jgi:hypothetical protein
MNDTPRSGRYRWSTSNRQVIDLLNGGECRLGLYSLRRFVVWMLKMASVKARYVGSPGDNREWKGRVGALLAEGVYAYLKGRGLLRGRRTPRGGPRGASEESSATSENGRVEVADPDRDCGAGAEG